MTSFLALLQRSSVSYFTFHFRTNLIDSSEFVLIFMSCVFFVCVSVFIGKPCVK